MSGIPTEDRDMYQAALGELIELSSSQIPKKIIGSYDYSMKYDANMKKLKTFSVAELEECAVFLKLKVRNDDQKKSKIFRTKEILTDRVIMKIESHFEELCDECNQKYRNKLDGETPYLTCFLCMQGSHDCEQITAKFETLSQQTSVSHLTGSVWLCRGCRMKGDLSCSPPKKHQKQSVTFKDTDEKGEEDTEEEEEENDERPSPRRDTHEPSIQTKSQRPNGNICPLYKRHQCPFGASGRTEVNGETCQYNHPRKCMKFCRFGRKKGGCNKGAACKLYHPVLCKYSVRSGECLNAECTYTHIKGTKRKKSENTTDRYMKSDFAHNLHAPVHCEQPRNFPNRLRKDSAVSVDSCVSESFRTPFPARRKRKDSEQVKNSAPSDFLEKLMENMKQGFSQQRSDIGLMKQDIDKQIDALWKQLGTISHTSLPQAPIFPPCPVPGQSIPSHLIPTWNNPQNQCSMY